MDDLVEWFEEADGFSFGTKAPHKWVLQAEQELRTQAAAITEAQATIARQQVMLDRALEDIGEKMVEIARLRGALKLAIGLGRDLGMTDMEEDAIRDKAALNTPETAPPAL